MLLAMMVSTDGNAVRLSVLLVRRRASRRSRTEERNVWTNADVGEDGAGAKGHVVSKIQDLHRLRQRVVVTGEVLVATTTRG